MFAALAMVDLLACGREHPPRAAELVEALAGRLTGLAVGHEVVERVTVVGDLELAVLALGRAEQRRAHSGTGNRLALGDERRPERRAGAVADAARALVGREVVQRDALAVDENASERRLADVDGRRAAAGEREARRSRGNGCARGQRRARLEP